MNEVEKWERFEGIHEAWKGKETKALLQKGLLVVIHPLLGVEEPVFTYAIGGEARAWADKEMKRFDKRRDKQ